MADRRFNDDETTEDDAACRRGGVHALRPGAGALHDATSAEIETLDRGWRVADVEAWDRSTVDLTGEEQRRVIESG